METASDPCKSNGNMMADGRPGSAHVHALAAIKGGVIC